MNNFKNVGVINESLKIDVINPILKWTNLKIYNTLTKNKEDFKSIDDNNVLMYSCWPTVYSDAHIWNLRSYIFPDILKKTLCNIWYNVKHIINITDVWHLTDDASNWDDKMELASQKRWENIWDISKKYTENFINDLENLNIEMPAKFTKATDYIFAQIEMIKGLEEKWYTYKTSDWIYFDTSKFPDYWKFANLKVENLLKWKRVDFWDKINVTDFALWKFSPSNWPKRQMEWDSPWWLWFPWWHIECSAMIWKELWDKIDIHTWWKDHIWVHHTNEIAQADCFHSHKTVNYWLHWEFLLLDNDKRIWKSEGNSIILNDIISKWYNPISYKFLVLMAHYRSFLKFSYESLTQAEKSLDNLKTKILSIYNTDSNNENISDEFKNVFWNVLSYLLDDLNTPMVISEIRKMLDNNLLTNWEKILIIKFFDDILGLKLFDFNNDKQIDSIPDEVNLLAEKRWKFKNNKNYIESDALRKTIEKMWYIVKDNNNSYIIEKIKTNF